MSKNSDNQRGVSPVVNAPTVSCGTCKAPDNSRMVACDTCGLWYHFTCVSVDESVQERDWNCHRCEAAEVQVIAGPSTPNVCGTAKSTVSKDESGDLQKQLCMLQKKLSDQAKEFEKMMKARDERYQKGLSDIRLHYERELGNNEQRLQAENLRRNAVPFDGVPTASSTGIPPPQITVECVNQAENVLSHQLKLLEEKQALEKRHLEERSQLLQRFGASDGGANDGGPTPQTSAQYTSRSRFFDVHTLSQSQLSARQGVSRELPSFSGNPEEWPLFIASYEQSTRICGYSEEENLLRLQRSLKGKALEVVRCRLLHPCNLPGVIATLRTLFGRPEVIIHSLINKVREMPSPKAEKLQTLIDFGVAVQNVCATIRASGVDEYLCNVALLQELTERLPPSIRLNWAYHQQTLGRATLADFSDWLGKLVDAASIVTIPSIVAPKNERRGRREDNYVNVHSNTEAVASSSRSTTVHKSCIVCQRQCSGPETCPRFLDMDVDSRWATVKDRRLCRKCLRKHFGACNAKAACGKNGCTYMHNRLLHDDRRYSVNSETKPTIQSCNIHSDPGRVLFRYVPVIIHGNGKIVRTFAFLDDGSSATFVEQSLVNELKLEGTPQPLCLNWTGGQQRNERDSVKLALRISGTHKPDKMYELPKVHTVRSLSLPKQSLPVAELVRKYDYLKGLPLQSYDDVSPRILIGMDNCRLGHALKSAEGNEREPVASKTRLGWLLYGPCSGLSSAVDANFNGYHSFHICPCSTEVNKNLDVALKEYLSIDSLGIEGTPKQQFSKDDERALQILSTETHLKGDRFQSGLLWRYDRVDLPDSKPMALKRFMCLKRRMNRDPVLAKAIVQKMNEYEEKGYIRRLSLAETTVKQPRDWYLPIFPVLNPNKPGKMRIVFDAAAKTNGVCLNSVLLTGPDQLASLLTVLYKFREFKVAVVGDIKDMFFRVLMKPQDQRSQMVLWNNDISSERPGVYVVTVLTFGAACSPSCAHYAKNKNAERFTTQFPRAVECIKYEHYVDDMLSSVDSVDSRSGNGCRIQVQL